MTNRKGSRSTSELRVARWRQVNEWPYWLVKRGLVTFGSADLLLRAVNATSSPETIAKHGWATAVRLVAPPGDNSVIRLRFEPTSRYGLERLRKEEGLVVDVGANIGYMSITVAKMQPSLPVLAIEPAPVTFFYFLWNCWLNRVSVRPGNPEERNESLSPGIIVAFNAAVAGRHDGRSVDLRFNPSRTQDAMLARIINSTRDLHSYARGGCGKRRASYSLSQRAVCNNYTQTVNVPTFDVLGYLRRQGTDTVQLLKLDCEGCEVPFVLNTLANGSKPTRPDWFINKQKVKMVVAELHQTHFQGLLPADVNLAAGAFTARGCNFRSWNVRC